MSTSLRPLESYQGSAKYVTIRPDYLGNRAPITGCPGGPRTGDEVLPSLGLEAPRFSIKPDQPHPGRPCDLADRGLADRDFADPRHSNPRDFGGDCRRRRKQQFIIVAAMQRKLECSPLFPRPNLSSRNRLCFDLSAHAAFLADVFEVSGKAVTHVNHGRCHSTPAQPLTHRNPRLRMKVLA